MLAAQPVQPNTLAELQALLGTFVAEYNHRRPHRSLPRRATPATLSDTLPKAQPATSRDAHTHDRIRHDRIDDSGCVTLRVAGRLHHIGVGRTHARTRVVLLVQDLHVPVSTPPPVSSSASSSSTPPRTTSPLEHPRAPPQEHDGSPNPQP